MPSPTPTRVHAPGGRSGDRRSGDRRSGDRRSGDRAAGSAGVPRTPPGRRSVTVCCRSASRRRSTVACCAGTRFAMNSSSARTTQAVRSVPARASLRCNLRRRCGGPERAVPGLLQRASSASAMRRVVPASAANGSPVPRIQRHVATGCRAAGRAPLRSAEGRCADCRRPHCRRDIWWRIG